jgi:hypothetical protein
MPKTFLLWLFLLGLAIYFCVVVMAIGLSFKPT